MFAIHHHKRNTHFWYTCKEQQNMAGSGQLRNPNNGHVLSDLEVDSYNGYTREFNRMTWRADKEFMLDQRHKFFVSCGEIPQKFTVNFDLALSTNYISVVTDKLLMRSDLKARGLCVTVTTQEPEKVMRQVRERHPTACNFRNLKAY